MPECRPATSSFQGRVGFLNFGHFNKYFVKNARKKGSTGKHFGVFLKRYNLTDRWTQSWFSKKGREASHSPSFRVHSTQGKPGISGENLGFEVFGKS